jgi:hypothetical protein
MKATSAVLAAVFVVSASDVPPIIKLHMHKMQPPPISALRRGRISDKQTAQRLATNCKADEIEVKANESVFPINWK